MKRYPLAILLLLTALVPMSCFAANAQDKADQKKVAAGTWGGEHVHLQVNEDGTAVLEFDCGMTKTAEPVILDDQGKFQVKGITSKQGGAGPTRVDEAENETPDTMITGKIDGDKMRLEITHQGQKEPDEVYNLIRGAKTKLLKCS
jgi:hypothetical protein